MTDLIATTLRTEFYSFISAKVFTPTEVHSAERIVNVTIGESALWLDYLAVAVAVWAPVNGHICINLARISSQILEEMGSVSEDTDNESKKSLEWPDLKTWITHLKQSALVETVDIAKVDSEINYTKPLVLYGSYLYLTRQWVDEGQVATEIHRRLTQSKITLSNNFSVWIDEIFDNNPNDMQSKAIEFSLTHMTMVLLGGPGTGKTHTIAGMMHALHCQHATKATDKPLRIAIAAPTAKASRQVTASVNKSIESKVIPFPQTYATEIKKITDASSTIHRLLGSSPENRGRFKHNATNKLPYDVVIIDEVSMVSLPLMARLLEALEPDTKLILVGDPQQLKSIEAGAVLPDIATLEADQKYPIVELTKNWRQFDPANPSKINFIGELARIIRKADKSSGPEIVKFLHERNDGITFIVLTDKDLDPTDKNKVLKKLESFLAGFSEAKSHSQLGKFEEALKALSSVRILCGHRKGKFGVSIWNQIVAEILEIGQERGSIGQPLLNTRNDIRTGLINGDNGIVVKTPHGRRAVFQSGLTYPTFEPTSLESVETAFATTIHKSQGSEYETVIVVVPPEGSPLLKRELIYTAVTRAIKNLVIISSESAMIAAIASTIDRESGLARRIRASK